MKKFISICLLCVITLCCVIGCQKTVSDEANTQSAFSGNENNIQDSITKSILTESANKIPEPNKNTGSDTGGGEIVQEKYRQCYYHITYQLSLLVDKDELLAWKEKVFSEDPDDTNEMIVKRFVLDFNISREDFDKANLALAKVLYDPDSPPLSMNPKDYINQEMFELYNADIIYTFDDEIINEYYLSGEYPFVYESDYEDAVASGEYTPRTEEWVDIEQMEAEIIAKYGEAEIVTTVAAEEISTEETSAEEATEAVTDTPETTVTET